MKILGIDSSTDRLSVGICNDGKIIADKSINSMREHGSRIIGLIDEALSESNIDVKTLQGIAVAIGPGSFTGLRVGMAAAKGLALTLNIPIIGISTFEVITKRLLKDMDKFILVEQARKGEFYFCGADIKLDILSNMKLIALENLETESGDLPVGLIGSAADWPIEPSQTISPEKTEVSGGGLAILGEERIAQGQSDDLAQLEPIYVAPSQAEVKFGKTKSSN